MKPKNAAILLIIGNLVIGLLLLSFITTLYLVFEKKIAYPFLIVCVASVGLFCFVMIVAPVKNHLQ